ncbi:unnamed protein product [Sphenostylis stenocarpa]|uniref:Uncharacterized protein n=1 Tax=Sphenostylis stenocarpa TaxID=92480 RepID=A0AA86W4G7_9FABA|nr:unnamed protein product [Sphenostylis stenocarpa]
MASVLIVWAAAVQVSDTGLVRDFHHLFSLEWKRPSILNLFLWEHSSGEGLYGNPLGSEALQAFSLVLSCCEPEEVTPQAVFVFDLISFAKRHGVHMLVGPLFWHAEELYSSKLRSVKLSTLASLVGCVNMSYKVCPIDPKEEEDVD